MGTNDNQITTLYVNRVPFRATLIKTKGKAMRYETNLERKEIDKAAKDENRVVITNVKVRPSKPDSIKGKSKDAMSESEKSDYEAWTENSRTLNVIVDFENEPRKSILRVAAKPLVIKLQNALRRTPATLRGLDKNSVCFVDAANHKEKQTKKKLTPEEHLKAALKAGMSKDEILKMLG